MTQPGRHRVFVRLFSSAVLDQALLSAASLGVSLILIRRVSDLQYGYYVLASATMLLLTSLQGAFCGPAMIARMTSASAEQRTDLFSGIDREQARFWQGLAMLALLVSAALWRLGLLGPDTLPVVLVAIATALAALRRDFLRTVLMALRRAGDVLKADAAFVAVLLPIAGLATLTAWPAAMTVLGLGLASLLCARQLFSSIRSHAGWNADGAPGILRAIAPLALWATAGAVVHWTFSQGYSWLVAATLDVNAVAAIGATRLLMMPVNLLSTGIGAVMLPLCAGWLHTHGARTTLQRLALFAAALALAALAYFLLTWLLRDWLFAQVLKKSFPQRDALLLLWGAVAIVAVVRDQLVFLPVARQRFRVLTAQSSVCAVVALVVSYVGMLRLGVAGALLGMLAGELLNIVGLLRLSLRELRLDERPDRPLPVIAEA